MTDHNTTEIYDNPASQMTTLEVFKFVGIDVIPFRGNTVLNGWGA